MRALTTTPLQGYGQTLTSNLGGGGALTWAGNGQLTLTGSHTNTGRTTISNGIIRINAGNIPGSSVVLGASGSLVLARTGTLTQNINISGNGLLWLLTTMTFNFGCTQLPASITVQNGTLSLTQGNYALNTGISSISVSGGGTLQIVAPHALGGSNAGLAGSVTINGGTLNLIREQYFGTLNLYGATVYGAGQLRSGSMTCTVAGTSASTISCPVGLYWGNTFNVGSTGNTGPDLTVSSVVSSLISGAGLVKKGAGTMLLSGSNSYSGGTQIQAGTLKAGNTAAFGTGTITLSAGATLNKGGFTIANTVVNNGGTIIS